MGLCGNVFENLFLGMSGVKNKKATVKHKCSKCGQEDEVEVSVDSGGVNVNFESSPGGGVMSQCPWNTK